jgi:hypothetical protein
VNNLTVTNSSIVFGSPSIGGFKTLTIDAAYVGSGASITLNTQLGNSSSPTDEIIVNGGSASGLTLLTIKNAGGSGAQTTGNGIPVIVVAGGGTTATDAFALASPIVVGSYRYTLADASDDWYLVSVPTPTPQQLLISLTEVETTRRNQAIVGNQLGSILLGATQQISSCDCGSGFGAVGSLALGTNGRVALSDNLTAIGGVSLNQWSTSGVSVTSAPSVAGALLYDFSNLGSMRPFIEAGGLLTPYESVDTSRTYLNGPTVGRGTSTSVDRNLALFARAGFVARLTQADEAAVYADFGRNWLQSGGGTEVMSGLNPYPATTPAQVQEFNIARVGAQYTRLFFGNLEANVSAAVSYGFGAGRGAPVDVFDNGPIRPNALPNTTWFEYGARLGYRVSDQFVIDAFVLGTAGGAVGATAHGGLALRLTF